MSQKLNVISIKIMFVVNRNYINNCAAMTNRKIPCSNTILKIITNFAYMQNLHAFKGMFKI